MVPLSVLVIDDDQVVCKCISDTLEARGYRVTVKTDAEEGLRAIKAKADAFHFVILDLILAGAKSGMDLLPLIRAEDDDIAVIILTSHASIESATASVEQGVSAYLRKPFDSAALHECILRLAKRKGLIQSGEDLLLQIIGNRIRDLRKDRGLTLKQLSRRTNLSVSLLSQIERAESAASVATLYKVATALGATLTDLLGGM